MDEGETETDHGMRDTLRAVLLTLPPISLDGVGIAPMFTGRHDARRSPLQPQVAARLAMGCLNDKWNYQS